MIVTRGLGQDSGQPTSLVMWGCGTYVLEPIVVPVEPEGSSPESRRRRKDRAKLKDLIPDLFPDIPVIVEGIGTVVQLVIVRGSSTPISGLSAPYFTYTQPQTEQPPALVRSKVVEAPKSSNVLEYMREVAAYLLKPPSVDRKLTRAIEEVIQIRESRGLAISRLAAPYMRGDVVNIATGRMQYGLEARVRGVSECVYLPESVGALEINEQELVFILDLLTRR